MCGEPDDVGLIVPWVLPQRGHGASKLQSFFKKLLQLLEVVLEWVLMDEKLSIWAFLR